MSAFSHWWRHLVNACGVKAWCDLLERWWLLAACRRPNCLLTRAMDGRILRCSTISSCQSTATSGDCKERLYKNPTFTFTFYRVGGWSKNTILALYNMCTAPNAWPLRCQTHGYLPSHRTSPLIDQYEITRLLIGDRDKESLSSRVPTAIARQ